MQEIEYTPLQQTLVFGSIAKGKASFESNLDIAVAAKRPLSAEKNGLH